MGANTLINGKAYSFANCKIDFSGVRQLGMAAINWKEALKPDEVRANAPYAVGRTVGEYTAEGDYEQTWAEYCRTVRRLGNGYAMRPFNIGVQYSDVDLGLQNVEILQARIVGPDVSNAKGPAPTTVKVTLSIIEPIRTNGITLLDELLGDQGIELGVAVSIGL